MFTGLETDSHRRIDSALMTTHSGCIIRLTRRVIYRLDELDQLADEFAGYAAHEIADLVQLKTGTPRLCQTFHQISDEVAFAIRCAVQRLPEDASPVTRYTPAHLRSREHYALLRRRLEER